MNEMMLNADGTVAVVGDSGSRAAIIAEVVSDNTIPAERDIHGVVTKEAVVPAANTLVVEITEDDLKTHAWRIPKARTERLEEIRSARNAKLVGLDLEYQLADEGVHPQGWSKAEVAAEKKSLRDLPPSAEAYLSTLNNTDDISAYDPLSDPE